MAAFTSNAGAALPSLPVAYGRSGYNVKADDDEPPVKTKGRSGYNKGDKENEEASDD
ncbi:hypothetical protein SPI_05274 [Niveomyces insectorum RCEF 264]|uniref:Uncharacterized protein n=1 Tax=Niveomyces insectorum RCEF 264 TaxID=1081102 RepID=A0A167U511_9HYPO|nr:hypothetical protein SPI_05274 [Niveomyces insectorum RCEF 264]